MVVLPLSKSQNDYDAQMKSPISIAAPQAEPINWVRIASAATLVASGALLLGGKRRAGLLAAAAGTSLALLDQKDVLGAWWSLLPGYIEQVQWLLNQAEGAVEEFAAQRERLGNVLGR
jgi:hypothetical protein